MWHLLADKGDKRDLGSIAGLRRPPRIGNSNPLQYSCLENSMDRGALRAWYRSTDTMSENTRGNLTMSCQPGPRERVFHFASISSTAPLTVCREGCCRSVAKSCPTFCNPWTAACQAPSLSPRVCSNTRPLSWWWYPSHTLPPPSPPTFNFRQHQSLFQWVSSSHQVAKVLEFQHQSFLWIVRTGILKGWLVWFPCSPRDSQVSSPTPQLKSINSSVLSFLYSPTLTPSDYWENQD